MFEFSSFVGCLRLDTGEVVQPFKTVNHGVNDVVMFAVREREELCEYGRPFKSSYSKKYISSVEEVLDFHRTFYFILARVDFDDAGSLTAKYLHDRSPVGLRFDEYRYLTPPLTHFPHALAYRKYVRTEVLALQHIEHAVAIPDYAHCVAVAFYVVLGGGVDGDDYAHLLLVGSIHSYAEYFPIEHLAYVIERNLHVLCIICERVVLVLFDFFDGESFRTKCSAVRLDSCELVKYPFFLRVFQQVSR